MSLPGTGWQVHPPTMDEEEHRQRYLHVLGALTELACADGAYVVVDGGYTAQWAAWWEPSPRLTDPLR